MENLSKFWTGQIVGTNVGNFFIEFNDPAIDLSGKLSINDYNLGLSVYRISGNREDSQVKITGIPVAPINKNISSGNIQVEAELLLDGSLKGNWKSSVGTVGLFSAFPNINKSSYVSDKISIIPEQIHTKNINLGAIKLYSNDVEHLLEEIKKDFSVGRAVVTYHISGHEVIEFSEDFIKNKSKLKTLNYLKISIQEPAGVHGITKIVSVELGGFGINNIRVQGAEESWVIGKAEKLALTLRYYESSFITMFKKFGLNLNGLIFITMLIIMPSINSLWKRTLFISIVFILMLLFLKLHTHFSPTVIIKMSGEDRGWFARKLPSIFSWASGIVATVIAALLYHWLMH